NAGVAALGLADERVELGHPERPGTLARRIDVVRQRDLAGVAGEEGYLARSEGGAQRRDNGVEARLVGHQGVGVALDDHGLADLADRTLRPVDEVERPALVEER